MSTLNSDIHPTSGEIDPGHDTLDEPKTRNNTDGLRLVLLGTGDAGGVPLYGCHCPACERARLDPRFIRRPSTALVETGGTRLLIDAGLTDLAERFPAGTLSSILLTHYHPDHVQGLFHLRWGMGKQIDVWSPPDPEGCADLYKNSGLLRFHWLQKFEPTLMGDVTVTPVPMIHSKITFGYCLEAGGARIAYLCDTIGLPPDSTKFLKQWRPDCIVLDCCYPPQERPPRNHNDVKRALECVDVIGARKAIFIHLSHELDLWLMEHDKTLAGHILIGYDGLTIDLPERGNV
ncbi:MAG: phosphonate metabolism protein PhnP [Xanthomonadales bacterium]|nr:phosphonate metabolism protein PhnP [Xanthomonadales bacterium]